MELDSYIVRGGWKKYAAILVVGLICLGSAAEVTHQDFQSVDDLIAGIKHKRPDNLFYDTNGIIEGLILAPDFSTDHNLRVLGKVKSLRYLLICNYNGITSNAIPALAEYPNLTGLGLVCCGSIHAARLLPSLTNLQSLELAQTTYQPDDSIYVAKMTNLTALEIFGHFPQPQTDLPPLTNLINLRSLAIWISDDYIKRADTNIFTKLDKLTNCIITSDQSLLPEDNVWKTPAVKTRPSTNDVHRPPER